MVNTETVDAYTVQDNSDSELQQGRKTLSSTCKSYKACLPSCYKVLLKLNLFIDAYKSIGLAYKPLLMLPVSQVACERSFSGLKIIKNRLQSTMTQD